MLWRGGLSLFIEQRGAWLIVVCAVRRLLQLYVSVRKYKQRKIATELHRPKEVSLPLLNAILRDDVLMLFITPPEFQTDPKYRHPEEEQVWVCGVWLIVLCAVRIVITTLTYQCRSIILQSRWLFKSSVLCIWCFACVQAHANTYKHICREGLRSADIKW